MMEKFEVGDMVVVRPEKAAHVRQIYMSGFSAGKLKLGQDFANGKPLMIIKLLDGCFELAEHIGSYYYLGLEDHYIIPYIEEAAEDDFLKLL